MTSGNYPMNPLSFARLIGLEMANSKETVGRNVLQLLKGRPDLSKARLAERLGVKASAVTKYVQGRSLPSAENLEKIAAVFGIQVYQLFIRWEDWASPPPAPPAEPEPLKPEHALRALAKGMGFTIKRIRH